MRIEFDVKMRSMKILTVYKLIMAMLYWKQNYRRRLLILWDGNAVKCQNNKKAALLI